MEWFADPKLRCCHLYDEPWISPCQVRSQMLVISEISWQCLCVQVGLGWGGPSIGSGVGSPVSLHRGSKAGPGWTLGEADKALEEYGIVRNLPPCFGSLHGTPDNHPTQPPPYPPSYRTFSGSWLTFSCALRKRLLIKHTKNLKV